MKKFEKFNQLSKGNRIFRIVNIILALLMLASCVVALAINFKPDRHRELPTAGMIIATVAPFIIELFIRKRIPNTLLFAYQVYMIIAGIVGAVYDIYYEVYWYDMFVHTLMGFIAAMLGIFVLSKCTDYKKLNVLTVVLFCFTFSLAVELVWELLEWFCDLYLGQTAQGGVFPGDVPLVTDTMQDILCNFSGTVLFILYFIIGKFSKVSFGVKSIENQLTGGECLKKMPKQTEENSLLEEDINQEKNKVLEEQPIEQSVEEDSYPSKK